METTKRPAADEWMRKMYTHRSIFSLEKEGNPAILDNTDGP